MKIIICDSNDNIVDTMKSYTDLEQSKKLAEILPLESADMSYSFNFDSGIYEISLTSYKSWVVPKYAQSDDGFGQVIPCWSLAALLDIIPYPTLGKHADETWSCASWVEKVNPYFVEGCDSPINACYEMILKLNEEKFL